MEFRESTSNPRARLKTKRQPNLARSHRSYRSYRSSCRYRCADPIVQFSPALVDAAQSIELARIQTFGMTSRNDSRLAFVLGVLVGQEVTVTVRGCGCGCGCVASSGGDSGPFGTGFRSAGSGSEVDASGGRADGGGGPGGFFGRVAVVSRAGCVEDSPGGESSSRNFAYCPPPRKTARSHARSPPFAPVTNAGEGRRAVYGRAL